jgi:hypothetical protein
MAIPTTITSMYPDNDNSCTSNTYPLVRLMRGECPRFDTQGSRGLPRAV